MKRNGRPKDQCFLPFHRLYHRCEDEDLDGDRLLAARIKFKNTSVNWSKYSKPWDVIFDNPQHGIVQFLVCQLPKELPKEQPTGGAAKLHSFSPGHVPLDKNYAHSEIWTYKDNERLVDVKDLPKIVKKEFRSTLSDAAVVLRRPSV